MLITDLDGSIGVSQTAPGSLSTDKPSWDFVVGVLSPSLCHSGSVLVCSVPSCHQPLVSPQLLVPLQPPLGCQGKPFDVTCVSFVTSELQPAAPQPLSCHFTALLVRFESQQSKAERKRIHSPWLRVSHQNKCKIFHFCGMELHRMQIASV